jgi:hypothetical protein
MTSPELARRVDRQAEDLRAISDTVLDIKDTVDHHTTDLADIKGTLATYGQQLTEILALLRQGR